MGLLRQIVVLAVLVMAPTADAQTYGDIEFPEDEHEHVDGWNFWWGAADLMTESGNRYTVGTAWDSLNGVGLTGHQVLPQQGPYKGLAINTMDGPEEWGHDAQTTGRYVTKMSNHVPGTRTPLLGHTLDMLNGGKEIGRWERTTMEQESYRLRLDNDEARVHPDRRAREPRRGAERRHAQPAAARRRHRARGGTASPRTTTTRRAPTTTCRPRSS